MINRLSLMAARVASTSFDPRSAAQSSMRGTQMHLKGGVVMNLCIDESIM